jgi:DNA polymerase III alpha subunit (gram-positive type)
MRKDAGMWFGCKKCGYIAEKNEEQSNINWDVYDRKPCPKCGEIMKLNFGDPIEGNHEEKMEPKTS